MYVRVRACVLEPNTFLVLRFSLQDQLFHPGVQSAALAKGSGREDMHYHLMEGEEEEESRRSEGSTGTRQRREEEKGMQGARNKGRSCGGY